MKVRPISPEPPLMIPYKDDWKSPTWILAYVALAAVVSWAIKAL